MNTNYQYDPLSRVTSLLHQVTTHQGTTTLDGATYAYDNASNALARLDARTNVTSSYGYDPIDQLTGVMQGATNTESYTYDAVGNRLSSLGVSPYSYNWSNELTGRPGVTYAYDSNDSETSKIDSRRYLNAWTIERRFSS